MFRALATTAASGLKAITLTPAFVCRAFAARSFGTAAVLSSESTTVPSESSYFLDEDVVVEIPTDSIPSGQLFHPQYFDVGYDIPETPVGALSPRRLFFGNTV